MAELDKIRLHKNDLPDDVVIEGDIAIDVESMGLVIKRDRLCLIQLVGESGPAHLVQFDGKDYSAPNLKRIISDQSKEKIFHFARFDVAMIYAYLGVWAEPLYCTKIASKIARTYSKSHGLKELCNSLLSVKLNKQQQTSDWGSEGLTKDQLIYAASDVLYLHKLRGALDNLLIGAERQHLARGAFKSLRGIVELEVAGWDPMSVFNHSTNQPSPFIPQPS